MKKIIPIILSLTAVMSTSTALAEENITVMLNGQAMDFDVAPIIQNDRVLVPMRAIFEELHCSVDYTDIDGRQIITAKLNENNSIGLVIGSDEKCKYITKNKTRYSTYNRKRPHTCTASCCVGSI